MCCTYYPGCLLTSLSTQKQCLLPGELKMKGFVCIPVNSVGFLLTAPTKGQRIMVLIIALLPTPINYSFKRTMQNIK
jgi:hypothetical protein